MVQRGEWERENHSFIIICNYIKIIIIILIKTIFSKIFLIVRMSPIYRQYNVYSTYGFGK